jgi:septum formation protein
MRTVRKNIVFHEVTAVTFNEMTDDEIHYYIENYQPFDKAGAYGIQDWIGITTVSRINGSYANVMGMPIDKVYQHLKQFADERDTGEVHL